MFNNFENMNTIRILVICTGNSCRSQMAEAYLRHYSKINKVHSEIYSAGIEVHGVNPKVIEILSEDNIDISNHTSNNIDEYLNTNITHIISVCHHANENCPIFPKKTINTHQNFYDPTKAEGTEKEIKEAFRKTRAEIKLFCENYINQFINEQ